jgi:hypothetical protein
MLKRPHDPGKLRIVDVGRALTGGQDAVFIVVTEYTRLDSNQ